MDYDEEEEKENETERQTNKLEQSSMQMQQLLLMGSDNGSQKLVSEDVYTQLSSGDCLARLEINPHDI